MKFRYYITDLMEGNICGTNSVETAEYFALSEDYFVVDSETGMWLNADGEPYEVQNCTE